MRQRGPLDVATQPLEGLTVVGRNADRGVQVEVPRRRAAVREAARSACWPSSLSSWAGSPSSSSNPRARRSAWKCRFALSEEPNVCSNVTCPTTIWLRFSLSLDSLDPDDPVWHPTTFTKKPDRLLNEQLMAKFLELLMASPEVKPLLSSEHFSVDGTLLRAWASHSWLERIDGGDDDPPPPSGGNGFGSEPAKGKKRAKGDFRGLLLSNQTHRSSSDAEARLFRKSGGTGAFLTYLGHCLMENRHGLVVASEVTSADGYGERAAAVRMALSLSGAQQKTLEADKGCDTRDFVADLRISGITPYVAQNIQPSRGSAIDGRTVRHSGYGQSINARKRIEQVFGWIKQAAGLRQLKARGRSRVGAVFRLHVVAYNLIRQANLLSPREVLA